ncbi:MAG TPA: glycosyltransferase family 39 protein, partial [Roseiflexaceae bacterium]|nr:glycosyltransferase family 39 protein [Roseiflexaceae bacterium]
MQHDQQAPAIPAHSGHRILWISSLLLCGIALVLRLRGIAGGLPWVDHPDEPNPVGYVIEMLRSGDLNPHAFQKPSLYVYMLLGVSSIGYMHGLATGAMAQLDTFHLTTHIYTTVPAFFLWGRWLTATLGALTVALVPLLSRRQIGLSVALFAGGWLAFSRFHLQHSQYVTTDVASGLLVLLTFAAALRIANEGSWHTYLLAGICAGLAASTKYNVGIAALMIVAAHVIFWRGRALLMLPRLMAAGIAALLAFIAGTPYALLSFDEFRTGMIGQIGAYNAGPQGDVRGAWNIGGYTTFFWVNGLLPLGSVATLLGLLLLWRRNRALVLVWLAFALPYLLLLLAQESHFMRNLIPLLVLCALPIGAALADVAAWFARRSQRLRLLIFSGIGLLLLAPGVADTLGYTRRLDRGDTRVALQQWLDDYATPGSRIAAELRMLPVPAESRGAQVESLPLHDLAWYRRQGYAFLIASSDAWRQWALPDHYATFGQPLISFGGETPRDMFGPRLVVFATGLSPADVPYPLPDTI